MKNNLFYIIIALLSCISYGQEKEVITIQEQQFKEVPSSSSKEMNPDKVVVESTNLTSRTGSTGGYSDIGLPANSPFKLGGNIQGMIQNSVSQTTGKIGLSVPLASIGAGNATFSSNITYSGSAAFDTAKKTNKYSATSVVGLGWSINTPKIIVNHKGTGARDDDDFYVQDGGSTNKLLCMSKSDGYPANPNVWVYQTERFSLWKYKYHFNTSYGDYWEMIKDDGTSYIFGKPSSKDAKEFTVRYGNWIGDSKELSPFADEHTIVWNLYKIQDLWGNNLTFEYLKTKQTISNKEQTEASYLKTITSSKGEKVTFNYNSKSWSGEYFDPHQEKPEPDAYHDRYEKLYLNNVTVHNKNNTLLTTHTLGYTINGSSLLMKRYLTSISQSSHKTGVAETLPLQKFEYHTSGSFKGGLHKVTYPTGGSVTYNYQNKALFYNSANKFATGYISPANYVLYGTHVNDNYSLKFFRSTWPVSGDKYRFKVVRYHWNGQSWVSNEFTLPDLLSDSAPSGPLRMQGFSAQYKKDFYAFSVDYGAASNLYLFHLNNDGRTWHEYSRNVQLNQNGKLLSGDEFVALGSLGNGRLETFTWNGSGWNLKLLPHGYGEFYYGAINNYILCLDEDGGPDQVTGYPHEDNYYMHYLDASKNWQTKTWSAAIDPYIGQISLKSYFYPANAMSGFMADHNPEFFLRWNSTYDTPYVDNVLGAYADVHPLQPSGNGMFTLYNWFSSQPYKTARFNGVNWSVATLPASASYYSKINFGEDMYTFQGHNSFNGGVSYHVYNPNYNSWSYGLLDNHAYANSMASGINKEFIVAGNRIFKKVNQPLSPSLFTQIGTLSHLNYFTYSDGLSHTFVEEASGNITFEKSTFYFMDKSSGQLGSLNLGNNRSVSNYSKVIGGNTSFMSPKSLWVKTNTSSTTSSPYLYRLIDDKFNTQIYDIVVDNIVINDDNSNNRTIKYTYSDPSSTPNNSITFYGEVSVENKGQGFGNIGKIKSFYNNGSIDLRDSGLPKKVELFDANNTSKQRKTTTWVKSNYGSSNHKSYHVSKTKVKEELFFNNDETVTTETNFEYNVKGQLKKTSTTNSNGDVETQEMKYHSEYSAAYNFMLEKNIVSTPFEIKNSFNNEVISYQKNVWKNDSGKAYLYETYSGPNIALMRKDKQISFVDTNGHILEHNNAKGIYNSALFGYNNTHEVALISNAKYQDVVNELDVTYLQLQNLTTSALKLELLKLYDRLPNSMIILTFYDDNGRLINSINERKEESYIYYDIHGRVDYITDGSGNVIEKKEYNFAN